MNTLSKLTLGLMAAGLSFSSLAATVTVEPGTDTLADAISAAADGDILVLKDGSYRLTESVSISQSLTIRAINATAVPLIGFTTSSSDNDLIIDGDGTDVILQGLTFSGRAFGTYRVDISVVGGVGSLALLENDFYYSYIYMSTDRDDDNNTYAIDNFIIVGNHFGNSSNYNTDISAIGAEENFIFAGNTLNFVSPTFYDYGADVNVFGNQFILNYNDDLSLTDSDAYYRVVGNQFIQYVSDDYDTSIAGRIVQAPVKLYGSGVFSNNIIRQGENPYASTGTPDDFRTMYVSSYGIWDISNNVFDMQWGALNEDSNGYASFDFYNTTINFTNNIMTGHQQPVFADLSSNVDITYSNNLCYNTVAGCPEGENTLNGVDPKFVDQVDYLLASDSPAIDAGIALNTIKDVDGSTVDIGAQAGPFPLSQFKSQLANDVTAPYLYPLFEANASLSNTGNLSVKALAVARQR